MTDVFYRFTSTGSDQPFHGQSASPGDYAQLQEAWRGNARPDRILEIQYSFGQQLLHVVWVSLCPLISTQVATVLRSGGLTGWETFPVRVFDRRGEPIPGYEGLSVTGRSRSVWINKEDVLWIENYRGAVVPFWKGLAFDKKSWDGSDLFRATDGRTDYVLISSRAHKALTGAGITNIRMEPVCDVLTHASGVQTLRPGTD